MERSRWFWMAVGAVVGVPLVNLIWWLASPLLRDRVVEEEFAVLPSVVPAGVTPAEAETVMRVMARVEEEVEEPMPEMPVPGADAPTADAEDTDAEPAAEGESAAPVPLRRGSFRDADSFHRGSGRATIYRLPDGSHLLRLEEFRVTNGPDLRLLLSAHPDPEDRDDLGAAGYTEVARLKGNVGSQNYALPAGLDVEAAHSVVIYCKPFHVVFSVAPLSTVERASSPTEG